MSFSGIKMIPCGFVNISLATGTAPATLISSIPGGIPGVGYASGTVTANAMLWRAEGVNARWRDDGVAPQPTVGMLMQTTDSPYEYIGNLGAIRCISTTGTASTLDINFYYTYS